MTSAFRKQWVRFDGVWTRRGTLHTMHPVSVAEANRMTGGHCSHAGYRRVWVVFHPTGGAVMDWPAMVCGGNREDAADSFERWLRREHPEIARDEP